MKHIIIPRILSVAAIVLSFVSCNKMKVFEGAFVAFDTAASSTLSVDAEGDFTGEYIVHYSGQKPAGAFSVTFSVIPGDGLSENIDYSIENKQGKITFLPGIYEQSIKIHWLSHDIDKSKNNTLTICLTDAEGITLGYPGPDNNMKEITIIKYSTKL